MHRDLAVVPEGTTEDKLIELWVRLKKSPHTQRAYQRDIQFFRDFVEKPLATVTLEDALDFCDSLDELETTNKRGEKKPLEDNSKRRIINSVKSLYSFAYSSGLFPANVMAAIKPPSAKSAISQRILTEATVLKLIVLEQDARNHAILHVLYAAGLRVSELCDLRWRHVIRRANGVQLDIMSGKGDKQRHVLLPESSWNILSAIREEAADTDFVFRSRQEVSREGYYKGTRLDTTTIFRIVREAAKRAGVPNWDEVSPHWLRHCHGSHAIDHQAPLTVVRDTLGHSNISVTNEYAKARPDQSSSGYLPLSGESRIREIMDKQSTENRPDPSRPLPRRAPPHPDEDLLSILRRSASRMGYPDVRWLLRPAQGNWFLEETDITLLSAEEDYHALGRLLLLSREELHSHTLHRFARLLESSESTGQPPGQDHAPAHLPQMNPRLREAYFLPVRSLRVCPLCLREPDCYDRLYWRMRLIFYCPEHRVRLLEKCPSCKAPIAASRPSPYTCPRCQHGDYRSVDTAPLSPENPLYLGERLLLGALGFELPSDETAARSLASSPLPTLSGASYLNLLKAVTPRLEALFSERESFLLIQLLCALVPEDSIRLQDLLLEKEVAVFLLFHWIFLAWPAHFSTFFDAWYSLSNPPFTGRQPESTLTSSLLLFYEPLNPDDFAWLRQAYYEYHRHFRYNPARIDSFRAALNTLAHSVHLQKTQAENASGAPREDRWLAYVPPRSLTPTVPYPWESLGSALSRAARKMDLPGPERLLYHPLFTRVSLRDFAEGEVRLNGEASDTMLAHLLQIPKEHIPHLTGLSLIASLGLPPENITRSGVRPNEPDVQSWFRHRPIHKTRVCPRCLEEQPGYDRVYWGLRGVLSCPRHRVRLLEKCPVCLKDIPAVRPQMKQCPYCKGETYVLPARQLPEESMLIMSTSFLLTMLQVPSSEASEAFRLLAPSPLLTVAPHIYFALLVELTEELHSYRSSSGQLLQLCRTLGESTLPTEQTEVDPYAVDVEVLLFHLIFVRWPENFFTFLSYLYRTVRFPPRSHDDIQDRWFRLLKWNWRFIVPDWLLRAFEEHEYWHRVLKDGDTENEGLADDSSLPG